MQKYKAIIEYCGTNYCGMQAQKCDISIKTIQNEVEIALRKFCGKSIENDNISINYSGRTDTGVHAVGQVIDFTLEKDIDCYKILNGLNFYLINEEIVILKIEKVDANFHSRFSAKSRSYVYKLLNRKSPSPLLKNRIYHFPYLIDISLMQKAAKYLITNEKIDFSSFKSTECQSKNTMKKIINIEIIQCNDEIWFYFTAKSYLHNMIRIIVGTLLEVGRKKYSPDKMINIINQKNRQYAGPTVPSHGLYFLKIEY